MSHIDPDREAWAIFKGLPRDQPINMLNLIRLKPVATYPDGHPNAGQGLSGMDAYRLYAQTTSPILQRLGGRTVWSGAPQVMVTGPQTERWDIAFVAEYPSSEAFMAMVRDPDYRVFVQHRTAATEDSRLIRCEPRPIGEQFWS